MFDVVHDLCLVMTLPTSVALSLVQAFDQTFHISVGDIKFYPFLIPTGSCLSFTVVIIFGLNYSFS